MMRIDDYLSSVGVIKRRTVAKELASSGLIEIGDRKVKASYQVKTGDRISVKGSHPVTVEVLDIPNGSVPREGRDRYFKTLD
ncbi:MAG: S4 domain-containing protein [bacterium]|nr:S4 domain-containing protein [bacterium]